MKLILDLCGGTGSWSEPYRKAGYTVKLITLPEYDVRTSFIDVKNVHGILAAPPCTMFSLARTTAKTPRNFQQGLSIVEACLRIVTRARLYGKLKWWAMENPVGYLRQFIGIPSFTFNPYDFGDPWTKPTDLWGYFRTPQFNYRRPEFNLDQAAVKLRSIAEKLNSDRGRSLTNRRPIVKLRTSDILAVTPPGFAYSFFKANP